MSAGTLIAIALFSIVSLWAWVTFNRLIRGRNLVAAAWSDIDVQLQRRHDLIPQLVEAVKAYAGYERATLETVTELRERSRHTQRPATKAVIENELEVATRRLIVLAESYPDLKANENFLALQTELADTEDHLQYARRFYNGAVRDYNTSLQSFPDLLLARLLRFAEREFFLAEADAETPVRVELD